MINLTKRQFKICEAVHLGLTHYYMGPHDKREEHKEIYNARMRAYRKRQKEQKQAQDH